MVRQRRRERSRAPRRRARRSSSNAPVCASTKTTRSYSARSVGHFGRELSLEDDVDRVRQRLGQIRVRLHSGLTEPLGDGVRRRGSPGRHRHGRRCRSPGSELASIVLPRRLLSAQMQRSSPTRCRKQKRRGKTTLPLRLQACSSFATGLRRSSPASGSAPLRRRGSGFRSTSGIWPTAWVEQDRHGS